MHGAHPHVAHRQPAQAVDPALLAPDGVEVGEDLGRVLAPAVAAVDDRHRGPLGGLVRRALLEVAHDDHVAVELEHLDRVLDRLLVEVAGPGHLGVGEAGDVAAEAVHGRLVGQPGAGRRLVEGRDQRLVLQQVAVAAVAGDRLELLGHLEDAEELVPLEVLERENVATTEAAHRLSPRATTLT